MDSSTQPLERLRAFRDSFYRCFGRRSDALFELTDALLTAGEVPSPVHLSLAPAHRRGVTRTRGYDHPYSWSPFVLGGDWR